ncbi:MAG TPA: hypothetical protein PKL88_01465 [bacterium]|nr:hypothetical protein [bacterium]
MIIPAILEKDLKNIINKVDLVKDVAKTIQIDVLDNTLIKEKTFTDLNKLKNIKTDIEIIIHLMVDDPKKYIKKLNGSFIFSKGKISNVSTFITQLTEDKNKIMEFIKLAKNSGYRAGISINTDQDTFLLIPFLDKIDVIQFMGVDPGKQGNKFLPEVIDKIIDFKNKFPGVETLVDGGISNDNFNLVVKTGVDKVVIGSSIFNTENPKQKFIEFSKLFEEGRKTAHGE